MTISLDVEYFYRGGSCLKRARGTLARWAISCLYAPEHLWAFLNRSRLCRARRVPRGFGQSVSDLDKGTHTGSFWLYLDTSPLVVGRLVCSWWEFPCYRTLDLLSERREGSHERHYFVHCETGFHACSCSHVLLIH